MKLKYKIILSAIVCFLLSLDVSVLYFTKKTERFIYNNELKYAEQEKDFIYKSISDLINDTPNDNNKNINAIISTYNLFYKQYDVYLKCTYDSDFTNNKFGEDSKSITFAERFNVPFDNYILIYNKKLSKINEIINEQKKAFIVVNFLFGFLAAIFISVMMNRILQPLSDINESIKIIQDGNFNHRINISSKDELQDLATEYNNMANSLNNTFMSLTEIAKEKEMLAENMAHEIRNPLTTIAGFSEYLFNANISDENRLIALKHINNETKRLQELCNKMLNISRDEKNIIIQKLSVKKIIEDINKAKKNIITSKDICFICKYDEEYIYADRDLILSLILNIIDNAINAIEANGKISLEFKKNELSTCITIKDNGIGIREKDLKNVFKPFYRTDKSRSRALGGSGLGLSICKKIVDLHNGNIYINSTFGYGTEVNIILPKS